MVVTYSKYHIHNDFLCPSLYSFEHSARQEVDSRLVKTTASSNHTSSHSTVQPIQSATGGKSGGESVLILVELDKIFKDKHCHSQLAYNTGA